MAFRFPSEKFEQVQPFVELWLRKIFLEDWSTKLIALAITLALWFGITGQQSPDTRVFSELPLNYRLSGNLDISNEPRTQLEITLTGDKGKLDRLNRRELSIAVDLSSFDKGERVIQLTPENVSLELASGEDLPAGLKITSIIPNKILVKLEPREEREVEVKPEFEGKLPDGLEVYEEQTTVTPEKIKVRGPASFVNSIDTVSTERIPLDNRHGDFTAKQVAV